MANRKCATFPFSIGIAIGLVANASACIQPVAAQSSVTPLLVLRPQPPDTMLHRRNQTRVKVIVHQLDDPTVPLRGVLIALIDNTTANGARKQWRSDSLGNTDAMVVSSGEYQLTGTAIAYKTLAATVQLLSGCTSIVELYLEQAALNVAPFRVGGTPSAPQTSAARGRMTVTMCIADK